MNALKMACLREKSLLYNDQILEIGSVATPQISQGGVNIRIELYMINKTNNPIDNFKA